MKLNTEITLEYNVILQQLSELALSPNAQEKLLQLKPMLNESKCKQKMKETSDAVRIIESMGTPPLSLMKDLDKILDLTQKGSMLIEDQLTNIAGFIASCRRMKNYLKKSEFLEVDIAYYGASFDELSILFEEIERSIRNGAVDDSASTSLRNIRRKIENAHLAIKNKLETILRGNKEYFADGYVSTRNGRFVLPVKKKYKNQISGSVIEVSGTGETCFIEPSCIRKLQDELAVLQLDEDNEVRKILYTLTALTADYTTSIKMNMDCMESLDFVFAKAKLSLAMKAIPVPITSDRQIIIKSGRHPLLNMELCVPLDFQIGNGINGVIITGPNTGGKTVALKTVGLLSLMAQSGLHVPVGKGSTFCMHSNILCDIGDGQSISENLSTFSSHITKIIAILNNLSQESLVLLDELGSGTDPAEGMGIAVSILEELRQSGCLFVATTHYPEIKEYASNADRLINARMEFDRESLKPLFKLQIGEAGESCALYIARRLGFPDHMLKRAQEEAYKDKSSLSKEYSTMEFNDLPEPVRTYNTTHIKKEVPKKTVSLPSESFTMGDSVMVYPEKLIGIVYKPANEMGEVSVQIKGKKQLVNHKRVKLITPASQLYPDDYDFSIVFDSVSIRKARHQMDKKYTADLVIEYDNE